MIDTTAYASLPPLRAATVWCLELRRGRPVPPATIAVIADVDVPRAKAYASILIARKACVEVDGGLIAGPAWEEWRASPAGRPVSSGIDPRASAIADRIRRQLCLSIRAAATDRGWSQAELARRAGICFRSVSRMWRKCTPLTAVETYLAAQALGVTVEQLVSQSAYFRR